MKVARNFSIGVITVLTLSACSSTKNAVGSNPTGFAGLAAAGLALTEELIELGGPTEIAQNPGDLATYEGYAGFVRMPLAEIDEEQIVGDPESYVEFMSQVTLETDLGNPSILGGKFYNFNDVNGSVDGELDIQSGNISDDGFGFLALSTDATGTVDGQSVDLTVDGHFLGDNAEGSYGWMDGEIGVDPFSGYFVAKR